MLPHANKITSWTNPWSLEMQNCLWVLIRNKAVSQVMKARCLCNSWRSPLDQLEVPLRQFNLLCMGQLAKLLTQHTNNLTKSQIIKKLLTLQNNFKPQWKSTGKTSKTIKLARLNSTQKSHTYLQSVLTQPTLKKLRTAKFQRVWTVRPEVHNKANRCFLWTISTTWVRSTLSSKKIHEESWSRKIWQ